MKELKGLSKGQLTQVIVELLKGYLEVCAPMATDSTPKSETQSMENRISASLENWKRKLLDLTKRNRALNFRTTKVSTVAIVDEQPAEVFRQLYIRGEAMRFKATLKASEDGGRSTAVQQMSFLGNVPPSERGDKVVPYTTALDEEGEETLSSDFAPYDPATLEDRHTDRWLQTNSVADALDKSLRRLDEQARSAVEEQGVNTLFLALGMLHYTESDDSEETFQAPLVLLPVELSRKSARSGYQVRAADEDPTINPALAEYLRSMGITLPALPDLDTIPQEYDLQEILTVVSQAVAHKKSWAVKTDIYLGLFSFQKLVMYKDLEVNSQAVATHRLIRQLITRLGGQIAGLPAEVREMDLDREYAPETTFQVVDADSSQLRAIAACAKNYDLVIEGPPGTGKSQTITNLVAQALSVGKSVLFVAEKMAALEVVHNRLVQAGLGEFCLELHSTKANKQAVMKDLALALDASFQGVSTPTVSTDRLPHVRAVLSEYVQAVHKPYGNLGLSPYRAYGELGRVYGAPRVRYNGPVDDVTIGQLNQVVQDLQELAATAVVIGVPAQHPWRDTARTFYSNDDIEIVREMTVGLLNLLADVIHGAEAVHEKLGFPQVRSFFDIGIVEEVTAVMKRSPGAPLAVLQAAAWNTPPSEATAIVGRGRKFERLKEQVEKHFAASVLDQEHAGDIAYIEQKAQGVFSVLAFLAGRYRSIRKRWLAYRLPSFQGSLVDQASEMKLVDRLQAERTAIAGIEVRGQELFGELWQGEESSWDALDGYIRWAVEFRRLCVRHKLSDRTVEIAAQKEPDVSVAETLKEIAANATSVLAQLRSTIGWPENYFVGATLADIVDRVQELSQNIMRGPQWATFESARQTVEGGLAGELLPIAMSGEVSFRDLSPSFLRAFYMKWISKVVQEREPLIKFHTLTHEERIAAFRTLDAQVLRENRASLVGKLRDRVQHQLQQRETAEQLPYGSIRRLLELSAPYRSFSREQSPGICAIH